MRARGRHAGKMCGAENGRKARLKTSKLILDEATGIFYLGVKEAANALGLKRTTMNFRLLKNTTSFKYV